MNHQQIKKAMLARPRVAAEYKRLEPEFQALRQRLLKSKRTASRKKLICLRVDHDVLDWFKSRGRGYQTRINTVLRAFRDASL